MDALLKALPKSESDNNSNKSSILSVAFSPKKPDGVQSPATLLSPKLKLGGLGGGKWALLKKKVQERKGAFGHISKGKDAKGLSAVVNAARTKLKEERAERKRQEALEMKRRNAEMKARLKKAKSKGGDSKCLDKSTERNRQKLEEERRLALEEKERQILLQTIELKRMQKNATAGDSKALDADTEAARQKL
eukprot:g12238.t1